MANQKRLPRDDLGQKVIFIKKMTSALTLIVWWYDSQKSNPLSYPPLLMLERFITSSSIHFTCFNQELNPSLLHHSRQSNPMSYPIGFNAKGTKVSLRPEVLTGSCLPRVSYHLGLMHLDPPGQWNKEHVRTREVQDTSADSSEDSLHQHVRVVTSLSSNSFPLLVSVGIVDNT